MLTFLKETVWEFWNVLGQMAPYLLFGFLIAGILAVVIPEAWVEKHLGGHGFLPILKASLLGVPLPLCSCGVIPVAASLRKEGASPGATASFLISTPQTGVDSIMVTLSLLGPMFALFRPVAAFVNGLLGGSLVALFGNKDPAENASTPECCSDATCGMHAPRQGRLKRIFRHGFVTLPGDIGKPLLAGLVVAALISALIPEQFFRERIGSDVVEYLLMLAVGIPVYVCATASVPVAAALITAGISPGAALVFLMTGPATNAATITTLWKTLGRRTTLIYLGTVAVTSVGAGLLLDLLFTTWGFDLKEFMEHAHGHAGYAWIRHTGAVVLLAVLAGGLFRRTRVEFKTGAAVDVEAKMLTLHIDGMTCSHCAETVSRFLAQVEGVESVVVDLEGKKALVKGGDMDIDSLRKAVEDAGYTVTGLHDGYEH